MTIFSMGAIFLGDNLSTYSIFDCISAPLYVLQPIALYGFIYKKPLMNSLFWKVILVITLGYEVLNSFELAKTDLTSITSPLAIGIFFMFLFLIQLPLWYGNYRYAFKSKEIWTSALGR